MTPTQTQTRTGVYEVMFLASQSAAATLGQLIEHMDEIFSRAHAEVLALRKWDERRLAFEIDKQKRGVYFLAYIRCTGEQVAHIERDVVVSEQLMRVLTVRADHLTDEEIGVHEQREQLAVEAKLKADQPAEAEAGPSKVRLGAPVAEEAAEPKPAEEPAKEPAAEPAAPSDG